MSCKALFGIIRTFSALALVVFVTLELLAQSVSSPASPVIQANSNRIPGGKLENGILTLHLELRQGDWCPEADTSPSMKLYAFGEEGKALQVPGPLIRVAEGTEIHVTLHNLLPATAVVHGLHQHPGDAKAVVEVPPQETRELRFTAGAAGTYQYYASAGGTLGDSGRPIREDSQLAGAFVVDPPGKAVPDRIFVLGIWRSGSDFAAVRGEAPLPRMIPVINGKSWPYTERLTYAAGETSALALDQCHRTALLWTKCLIAEGGRYVCRMKSTPRSSEG